MNRDHIGIFGKTLGFLVLAVLTLPHVRAAEGDPYAEILQPAFRKELPEMPRCRG